ncbi:MAG: 4Fe-4S dicluster domain-containing protein [Candidatus Dadabacteria bacterium]|nr:MAG: 4Fe-4S dicluster domain-containing protein [Candidatus Dadabacteria bacterium]
MSRGRRLDVGALRAKLAGRGGKDFWRSLEELADTEEFRQFLEAEFPEPASLLDGAVNRRAFLKLMGASLALAGLSACTRQPTEHIFPYVKAPEQVVPGKPLFFATAITLAGVASGVLVESHLGRPTKIEGNPDHPASLGATDVPTQAAILGLYDPDRSKVITNAGKLRPWQAFVDAMTKAMEAQAPKKGAGLRLLTGTVTSPTLADQIERLLEKYPEARWYQYEPVTRDGVREGARLAFGEAVEARYRLTEADVIVSLDADFLASGRGGVRYAREFAQRRRPAAGGAKVNRLYAVEPTLTITGAMADHRLAVRASEIAGLARALAARVGTGVPGGRATKHERWIDAVARDLKAHRGRCLVVAGEYQDAEVHALAHAMNVALGNVGRTVVYTEPIEARPVVQSRELRDLVDEMKGGRVDVLVMLGVNPAYAVPAEVGFEAALGTVRMAVHVGLYDDETARLCHWHVNQAHELEAWGDARAFDGTVTIQQPLIEPLYDGKTPYEVLAVLLGEPAPNAREIVRAYWKKRHGNQADFERFWRRSLHDGVVAGTAAPVKTVSLRPNLSAALADLREAESLQGRTIEVTFRADPHVYDGRFSNNGWLQELPKPGTRLTWENAALVAPRFAARWGVATGDVIEIRLHGRRIEAPVWVAPGQAEDSITLHLGYGRRRAGKVGTGIGFDAFALMRLEAMAHDAGAEIRKLGRRHLLATTQHHHSMEGRDIVREVTVGELGRERAGERAAHGHESLYPDEHHYDGYAWGMSIDLAACIGCGVCTIACQAENNVPVVGKDQVSRGREMHWIRVDRYFAGDLDAPRVLHQPVPCMQCEKAPCELVCPVNATVHSDEGLNDMVYNRCVGTRYCSNNCPYKVRRFNFYLYQDWYTETLKMQRNPDVTVRSRGVMEKCTYCVQRISHARITAKREGRRIRDGEIVTACEAACPTGPIVFGDINDPGSRVSAAKRDARTYHLLEELGTRPRTSYMAAVRNPNPELDEGEA